MDRSPTVGNRKSRSQKVRQHLESLNSRLSLDCWNMEAMLPLKSIHNLAKDILSWKFEMVLTLCLTVVILACLPIFAFLFVCMVLIRQGVSILAKHFRPDLGSIIPARNAGFAVDLAYNRAPKYNVVVPLYLDGHLTLDDFRARVTQVLEKKDVVKQANSGRGSGDGGGLSVLRYPQLKQYVYQWLGILFWRWERNFKVENHVNLLHDRAYVANSGEMLHEDDLARIGHDLASRPFRKGHSPWEFLLLHHICIATGKPRTLVILRIHHGLADGFSILKFCMEDLSGATDSGDQESKTQIIPEPMPDQGPIEHFLRTCQRELTRNNHLKVATFVFRAAYDIANTLVRSWDFNAWKLPGRKMKGRARYNVTKPIPLEYMKKIKNRNQVAFTPLVLASFTGALRSFMLEKSKRGDDIPDYVHCMISLPYPGHNGRLTNHMTAGVVRLPLNIKSPQARLMAIERELEDAKQSTIPVLTFYGIQFSGLAFAPITNLYFGNFAHTCVLSNFPGPSHPVNFAGHDVLDGSFSAQVGDVPFGFTALSYNGNIRLSVGVEEALVRGSGDPDFACKIVDELKLLEENLASAATSNTSNQ